MTCVGSYGVSNGAVSHNVNCRKHPELQRCWRNGAVGLTQLVSATKQQQLEENRYRRLAPKDAEVSVWAQNVRCASLRVLLLGGASKPYKVGARTKPVCGLRRIARRSCRPVWNLLPRWPTRATATPTVMSHVP